MTLAELGAQLKEERMGLGLMVEDVAARLKVPARILRAIEEGDVNDLPHTVYTRGFIKGYGLIVGYSNDKVTELLDSLEDFDDDFSPHRTREVKPQTRDTKKKKDKTRDKTREKSRDKVEERRSPRRKSRLGLIIFGLLLLGVAGGFYYYYSGSVQEGEQSFISSLFSGSGEQSEPAQIQEQDANPIQTPQSQAVEAPSVWIPPLNGGQAVEQPVGPVDGLSADGISNLDQPLPGDNLEGDAGLPGDEQSSVATDESGLVTQVLEPETESGTEPDSGAEALPDTGIAPPASGHEVVLVAADDCWIRYAVDNGSNRELTLHNGDNYSISFNTTLSLRLGRPQSVTVYFDGVDTGINQRYNGPVTLNIPQDL